MFWCINVLLPEPQPHSCLYHTRSYPLSKPQVLLVVPIRVKFTSNPSSMKLPRRYVNLSRKWRSARVSGPGPNPGSSREPLRCSHACFTQYSIGAWDKFSSYHNGISKFTLLRSYNGKDQRKLHTINYSINTHISDSQSFSTLVAFFELRSSQSAVPQVTYCYK